jgi:hypothetical protein
LKRFKRNQIATRSETNIKWDETFFNLKHLPEDEYFGSDLKEIIELELGEKSFICWHPVPVCEVPVGNNINLKFKKSKVK